jgi:hypothetical protein
VTEGQRNILIIVAIAVIGTLFFGDTLGLGAGIASLLVNVAFTVAIVWFLVVLYQRHQGTIATMPSAPRTVLQVCGVVLIFLLLAGLLALFMPALAALRNPVLYWPALFLSIFGIWWAWQQRTSRW